MRLAVPIIEDFAYLAKRMRPDEIEQFLAFSGLPEYVPDVAARTWAATGGEAYALLGNDGCAIAVAGMQPVAPGVMEAWMVGTMDGWDRYWRTLTKLCRRQIDTALKSAHRVQICSLASRVKAGEWYVRGLGMRREGLLRRYANGHDAVMYARTNP